MSNQPEREFDLSQPLSHYVSPGAGKYVTLSIQLPTEYLKPDAKSIMNLLTKESCLKADLVTKNQTIPFIISPNIFDFKFFYENFSPIKKSFISSNREYTLRRDQINDIAHQFSINDLNDLQIQCTIDSEERSYTNPTSISFPYIKQPYEITFVNLKQKQNKIVVNTNDEQFPQRSKHKLDEEKTQWNNIVKQLLSLLNLPPMDDALDKTIEFFGTDHIIDIFLNDMLQNAPDHQKEVTNAQLNKK